MQKNKFKKIDPGIFCLPTRCLPGREMNTKSMCESNLLDEWLCNCIAANTEKKSQRYSSLHDLVEIEARRTLHGRKGKRDTKMVLQQLWQELENDYLAISKRGDHPWLKLRLYAETAMKHGTARRGLYREAGPALFSSWNLLLADANSWYWKAIDLIAGTLEEAAELEEMREVNSYKMATLFFNSICSLMSQNIFSTKPEDVEEDVNDLMDLYFNGWQQRVEPQDFIALL